jgi:hypothetical protein
MQLLRCWVSWILAAILLTAALMKLLQGGAFHYFRHTVDALPWAEMVLSLWLISGIRSVWSLGVASAVFFSFCIVTLWLVVQGRSYCGCFGDVSVSPKVTYWIDLAAFSAAIGALGLARFRIHFAAVLLAGAALYLVALAYAGHHETNPKIEVGTTWPLAGAVDCSADLSKGRWIVLIYSTECGRCLSLAADYARDGSEWTVQGKKTRLALLNADISGGAGDIPSSSSVVRGSLLQVDLYSHTPILLLLDQGRVLTIQEGWGTIDWSHPPYSSWVR